jgi:hypothetical protein
LAHRFGSGSVTATHLPSKKKSILASGLKSCPVIIPVTRSKAEAEAVGTWQVGGERKLPMKRTLLIAAVALALSTPAYADTNALGVQCDSVSKVYDKTSL